LPKEKIIFAVDFQRARRRPFASRRERFGV
jgi:hypothetical protein